MPYETTIFQLPCGARCVRMVSRGTLTAEDATTLIRQSEPGGELHGLPFLMLSHQLQSVSPEARSLFGKRGEVGDEEPLTAIVVTNPVVRVTSNFLMRVQRTKRSKLFSTEEEALRWLDARIREQAPRPGAGRP